MDGLAMDGTDVVAMGRLRRLAGDGAAPVHSRQLVLGAIEAVDLLQAFPHRIVLAVPGELMSVDQWPWRRAGDDEPRQKTIARAEPQVACRFPAAAAHVVERALG